MANVLISIVANSHCNTGGKFEDRPMFELSSPTLITLEIPSAASTKSCPTLFNKGSRSSIVSESTIFSTHTPRFSGYKQVVSYDKKNLLDTTAAGVVADLDANYSLVSGPNIPVIDSRC